jgi:hypothetical protein
LPEIRRSAAPADDDVPDLEWRAAGVRDRDRPRRARGADRLRIEDESETDREVAGAATAMVIVVDLVTTAFAVNVTATVHVAPAARVAGQVLVASNAPPPAAPNAMRPSASGAAPAFHTVTC